VIPGRAGRFRLRPASSFALTTAVSNSFGSRDSSASRSPIANCASLVWLRSGLFPNSRPLSTTFSSASFGMIGGVLTKFAS
jgi:hypothetical protein